MLNSLLLLGEVANNVDAHVTLCPEAVESVSMTGPELSTEAKRFTPAETTTLYSQTNINFFSHTKPDKSPPPK